MGWRSLTSKAARSAAVMMPPPAFSKAAICWGHGSLVEGVGIGGDFFEGLGQFGLLENFAGFIEVAVALEDAGRLGVGSEVAVLHVVDFAFGESVAVGGEADGGGHVLSEGELAEVLLRVHETGDRAGDSAGEVAAGGEAGDDVALGIEVHVGGGCGGGFFAVVEEVGLAGFGADEHEASAAEVSGTGEDDGEGKSDGYRGVNGVAALLEDGDAGVGGVVLAGDDHGVFGAGGLLCHVGGLGRGRLGEDYRCGEQGGGTEYGGDGLPGTESTGGNAGQVFLQGLGAMTDRITRMIEGELRMTAGAIFLRSVNTLP